jgi:hypothetical protein
MLRSRESTASGLESVVLGGSAKGISNPWLPPSKIDVDAAIIEAGSGKESYTGGPDTVCEEDGER